MVGKVQVVEAEGGHQRGMVRGDEVGVVAKVRIGGRQAFRVVVCRCSRRAGRIVDQRTLQLVGDDAELIAAHVQQRVDAGLDAHRIGRGDELAIGDQAQLMCAGNDPLRIGRGDILPQPQHARAQVRSVVDLARGVFRAQFRGMRAFMQLCGPLAVAHQQAPVVGGADGVEQVEVRRRICRKIDVAAMVVAARDDGSDTHVEIGVGLSLAVHPGKAVDEAGDEGTFRCSR